MGTVGPGPAALPVYALVSRSDEGAVGDVPIDGRDRMSLSPPLADRRPDPGVSDLLRPYVPRLVVDWLRTTPDALHREVEGSLVFVDISGFTALTEQLARRGKIGAELMRDTLDGVFTALLDEAYDWGAGLLKWGGDALLLLFDGPHHEERSARAAWEMQRTIDRVGRVSASGARVTLRMSVGIGTGRFHFFMTGSVHRELLVAGPAVTETLVREGIADAGEIGLSPALALRLDPSVVGPTKLAARLLVGPPEAERERAADVGDVSMLDIASCIPIAARAHVMLQRSEAEHRTITAAFIDLMDTDRLLDELGPDALAEALDQRLRSIQEAAWRYNVPFYESDVGKSSVKALLTAGAPTSTGHDEERMLRALREVMDQPGVVPMRVGVNTGKVFTGDFGPPYRRAYRVFGDAINTAARVMAKAEAGQILSTEIVLNRSRSLFETTSIEPFDAKGKREPVHASIVGKAIGTRDARHAGAPLLGRDAELKTLLDAIERARGGQGTVAEVVGGPGLGKTRLVEEAIARCPEFRVLRTRCEIYEAGTPYFPMRDLFRTILGVDASADDDEVGARLRESVAGVDPALEPWLPLFGILLGIDIPHTPETRALDGRFLRERLGEVAIQFVAGLLGGTPTMVVIEDVQHLDEATRDLLERMSGAAADRRQILIVTHDLEGSVFDADGDGDTPIETVVVRLEPLSVDQMIEIVDQVTEDAPLHPHDVELIARRSAGNTLFLFELIDAVRETGTAAALPDSIESLVAAEVDRLAPADRTILRYAAVLGTSFDPELLIGAMASDVELDGDVWSRLDGLLEREPSGDLRFRNALLRDAAYEGLPYRRRRALHARVGEAIESRAGGMPDDETGVLAIHYSEAQRWDKAWRFSLEAGDRAMEIYANVEATRFYARALAAGRRLRSVAATELAAVHERNAESNFRLGAFDAADRDFEAARRLLGRDPVATAPLVVRQAASAIRTGRLRRAAIRAQVGLRRLEGQRGPAAAASRARLMVPLAAARTHQNRYAEAVRWARQAIPEAKRGRARDALAEAYKILDLALWESGRLDRATHGELALAIYAELNDLRNQALVLNNMGLIAHDRSNWEESSALYQRGLAIADRIGDRSLGALMKFNLTEILIDRGLLDDAEPVIREVIRLWRAAGAETDVAEANRELARLLSRRGHFDEARSLLDATRAYHAHEGIAAEVLRTDVRRSELLLLEGRSEEALGVLAAAAREAVTTDGGAVVETSLIRLQGCALLQLGRIDAARDALGRALRRARAHDERLEEALSLDALIHLDARSAVVRPELVEARAAAFRDLGIAVAPAFATGIAAS
jgi:class 3 adenylate cyclase/tetratricopeptide (TPR) repeat protein